MSIEITEREADLCVQALGLFAERIRLASLQLSDPQSRQWAQSYQAEVRALQVWLMGRLDVRVVEASPGGEAA